MAVPTNAPTDEALRAVTTQRGIICPLKCGADQNEINGKCVAKEARAAKAAPTKGEAKCYGIGNGSHLVWPCGDPRAGSIRAN